MEIETITEFDEVLAHLKTTAASCRIVVGIDGMEGVGKTTLAKKLEKALRARVVSLDDYVKKKRGAYVPFLKVNEIRGAIHAARSNVIVDGVCLRAAAARCGFIVDVYVYVRRIGKSGLWYDENVALTLEPVDLLKERDRGLRELSDTWAVESRSPLEPAAADAGPGLAEELIDYHAQYKPVERANFVFDVVEKE